MKKLLTLPNILKAAASLLGLVAFFLMFANQLVAGDSVRLYVSYQDALFGDGGAAISFVGYLLVLLAALAACALVLVKLDAKVKKLIVFALAFLLLLGAIFVFIEASVFNGKYGNFRLTAGPVFAGILSILAALLLVGSEIVSKK